MGRGGGQAAGVEAAIRTRISAIEAQNAAAVAAGKDPVFSFVVPLSQIEANIKP